MPKPACGRDQSQSGQHCQNPDEPSSNPDARSQNPDNYTHCKPLEDPFEASIENTLKSSGKAGLLQKHDEVCEFVTEINPLVAPIFCDESPNHEFGHYGKEALQSGKVSRFLEDQIIQQSDDQTLEEFIAALKSQHDDVVTLDDLPHDSLKIASVDPIVSDYDWKHVREQCESNGVLFDAGDVEAVNRSRWFCILVKEFIKEQDAELLRTLVEAHDPDVTLKALAEKFLDAYSQNKDRLVRSGLARATLKTPGFYAGLELLVSAIQTAKDLIPSGVLTSGLGSEMVESVCDAVLEEVAKTEKGRYEALQDLALERHADYREGFVWGGDDDAFDSSVSPKRKAMIFMKYVTQLKAAGAAMTITAVDTEGNIVALCVRRMKDIHCRHDDLDRVTVLFEKRPWITVDTLTKGFRAYVGAFINGLKIGESFKKPRFYSTKVVTVSWFIVHLDLIAKELCGDYGDRFLRLSSPA
jgi:hypothetical protein